MKYTPELTSQLLDAYKSGQTPEALSALFTLQEGEEVPVRSIIAKLSSLGVYTDRKSKRLNPSHVSENRVAESD